jgi:hypothetical protein
MKGESMFIVNLMLWAIGTVFLVLDAVIVWQLIDEEN